MFHENCIKSTVYGSEKRAFTGSLVTAACLLFFLSSCAPGTERTYMHSSENPSRNLLRNTSFIQSTTVGLPDYWGAVHTANEWGDDWKQEYLEVTDEDVPFRGVKSLKITVPPGKKRMVVGNFFHYLPSMKEYTFSVYMKSGREGHKAILEIGGLYASKVEKVSGEFDVDTAWKRYVITGIPKRGHWMGGHWQFMSVAIISDSEGVLQVAAPQLEFGSQVTSYMPAPADSCEFSLPVVKPVYTDSPPKIDGKLDDECWKKTQRAETLVTIAEGMDVPEGYGTSVRIVHDRYNIYVAFYCRDKDGGKKGFKLPEGSAEWRTITGVDSVEVFLKPDLEKVEYYNFIAGRDGSCCDVKEYWFGWNNREWKASTSETEDGWTAEFAIPFYALVSYWEDRPFGRNPGINLFRNRIAAKGVESTVWFDTPDRATRKPGAFGCLEIDMSGIYYGRIGDMRLIASGVDGLDVLVEIQNLPCKEGKRGTLLVEVTSPFSDSPIKERTDLELNGQPSAVRVRFPGLKRVRGNYRINAALLDETGRKIVSEERRFIVPENLQMPGSDLVVVIERSYYTREKTARLKLSSNMDIPLDIEVSMGEGDSAAGKEKICSARLEPHVQKMLTVDIENLPYGEHWFSLEGKDSNGRPVVRGKERIVKCLPAEKEVKIDNFRRMILVNGKPFIAYTGNSKGPAVLGDTKTITRENQKIITWQHPRGGVTGVEETLKPLMDDERVIAWKFLDESYNYQLVKDIYTKARAMTPYMLIYDNMGEWVLPSSTYEGSGGTIEFSDVLCQCQYPLGNAVGYANTGQKRKFPFDSTLFFLKNMRRAAEVYRKIGGIWLPVYGFDDAYRNPTPDEIRSLTYLGFIYGVRIFKYFHGRPMSDTLWNSLVPLGKEMEIMADIVGDFEAEEIDVGNCGDIHYALWKSKDAFYLIAANSWSEKTELTYRLPVKADSVKTLFETRKRAKLSDRRILDVLGPFERAVYEFRQK